MTSHPAPLTTGQGPGAFQLPVTTVSGSSTSSPSPSPSSSDSGISGVTGEGGGGRREEWGGGGGETSHEIDRMIIKSSSIYIYIYIYNPSPQTPRIWPPHSVAPSQRVSRPPGSPCRWIRSMRRSSEASSYKTNNSCFRNRSSTSSTLNSSRSWCSRRS